MQVSGRQHQTLEVTGQSVVYPQTKKRGPCPVCKQYFPELKLGPFIKHRNSCKGDLRRREVSCPDRYINSSLSNKKHSCQICAKVFGRKSKLKEHVRIHTGEKPYVCNLCNKSFRKQQYLTVHKRIHTGERPYKCEQCNRRFNQRSQLLSHQYCHTDEKPFKCRQCGNCFSRKSYLNRHLAIHTGEKPYG